MFSQQAILCREPFPVDCRQQRSEQYFESSKKRNPNRSRYHVLLYTHCQCMEHVNREGGIRPSTIHNPLSLPLRPHRCWAILHLNTLPNKGGRQSISMGRGSIVGLFEVALLVTYGSVGGCKKNILIHECGSCRNLTHHPVEVLVQWQLRA